MEKGIDKATERALEAYPPKYVEQKRHPKKVQSEKVDTHQPMRTIYIKGYRQAEKDNELTWEDMECIIKHYQDIMAEKSRVFVRVEDYQELLKRFKERKK